MHRELAFAFHHIKGVAEIFHSAHIRHYGLFLVDFDIYRVFSIYRVIDSFTRIAALLDLQNIIESSA